ncbi:MAG: hypothetical protein JW834_00805 [Candidatus Diapherotrites archaeon]|nr:hypothetical protein [Candidatus Diapherotrites archaeon]
MARVFKANDRLAVEVPDFVAAALNVKDGSECVWDMEKDHACLRVLKQLDATEAAVLKKIGGVKFAERDKERVRHVLNEGEQRVLGSLMKKGAVSFYEEGKYKGHGVYSISRDYYDYVTREGEPAGNIVRSALATDKHIIAHSQPEAEDVISQLEEEVRSGRVVVVRGFDKNYYITTSDAVENLGSKLIAQLESGDHSLEKLAFLCGVEESLAKTVLEVLKESGDILEKKRGLYSLA